MLCAIALSSIVLGCATTYGRKPVQDPLNKNMYSITVYVNQYMTQADADAVARREIAKLLAEGGYQDWKSVGVHRGAAKYVYDVLFSLTPFPPEPTEAPAIASAPPAPEGVPVLPGSSTEVATGTGFVIAEGGYVLTCAHVVEGAANITLTSTNGTIHSATIAAIDGPNDWCLLHAPTLPSKPIPVAPPDSARLGAVVYSLAYPLSGLLANASPVVGSGNIAALQGLGGDSRHIQVNLPINPGSSGSPILNEYGQWIALASHRLNDLAALRESGSLPQGVNFGVKASVLVLLMQSITDVQPYRETSKTKCSLEKVTNMVSASVVAVRAQM